VVISVDGFIAGSNGDTGGLTVSGHLAAKYPGNQNDFKTEIMGGIIYGFDHK